MANDTRNWSAILESLDDDQLNCDPEQGFTLLEEVGRGGAKIIQRAIDNQSGREVAYATPINNSAISTELFFREARISAYLQHPNILPIYEVSDKSEPFFIAKLLRGQDLTDFIKSDHSQNQLLALFKKICQAMEYAHSRGVIHLDLKPENIRLDKYGEILIIDWGLSEIFCNESPESPLDNPLISNREVLSADFTALGTPGFMSPEQIRGDSVTTRSDIFSLGALLYFMFFKLSPFETTTRQDTLNNTITGSLPANWKESLNTSLVAIIEKCLETTFTKRYSSISELLCDLEAFENNYAPQAEHASFKKHCQLLYKRNKTTCHLLLIFSIFLTLINLAYILELKQSRTSALKAKDQAEQNWQTVLLEQKRNSSLSKSLAPRYTNIALEHWTYCEFTKAVEYCNLALKMDASYPEALLLKGKLNFVFRDYPKALEAWDGLTFPQLQDMRSTASMLQKSSQPLKKLKKASYKANALRELIAYSLVKSYTEGSDLSFLRKAIILQNLNIEKLHINFKNSSLDLSDNPKLNSLNFLGAIPFHSIDLSHTNIDNLSFIRGRNLKSLDLSYTPTWDLQALSNASINTLKLNKTYVSQLWALENSKIQSLELQHLKLNLSLPIKLFQNLKQLSIHGSTLKGLPSVNTDLERLDISESNFQRFENLLVYSNLKHLITHPGQLTNKHDSQLAAKGIEILNP